MAESASEYVGCSNSDETRISVVRGSLEVTGSLTMDGWMTHPKCMTCEAGER